MEMAKCKFCGKDAGLLRGVHPECQDIFETGKAQAKELAVSAATSKAELYDLEGKLALISDRSFMSELDLQEILIGAFETAVEQALEDDLLEASEEDALANYMKQFGLQQDDLNQRNSYTKLVQAGVLRDILEGNIPERVKFAGHLPFNLLKSEKMIYVYDQVEYREPRSQTTYSGSSSGVNVRIAKGVYYRIGGFKAIPQVTSQMTHIDTGVFAITNKHVYFTGKAKSFRVAYPKIVSFSPYTDALGIQRDAASAKPQVFSGIDGWFVYNLVVNLSQWAN
ncbi:MAG: hypothetical protein KJZ53_02895 [Anaerolineales bacterium]|nr:hypothetical protein [Anaerolineales bacterium]